MSTAEDARFWRGDIRFERSRSREPRLVIAADRLERLLDEREELIAAAQALLSAHTESAGLTMSVVADKEQFSKFMDAIQKRVDDAVERLTEVLKSARGEA